MKISKYVFMFKKDEDVVLYNSVNHSVIELPNEVINGLEILTDELDNESIQILEDMGFLSSNEDIIDAELEKYLIKYEKLFISVELNLSCNLKCPYCYQSQKRSSQVIDDSVLNNIVEYMKKVYSEKPYKELYLKVLGGEPTLVWHKFLFLFNSVSTFCRTNNIKLNLLIDTNGTLISDILELKGYDSLLLTIPLTWKDCHNSVRFDSKGLGTYDQIISNINLLYEKNKDIKIVLRYNVDSKNKLYFRSFLQDIKSELKRKPLVSVNYTAELNGDKTYKNDFKYNDFIDWCSTQVIDDLVDADLPITISPYISIEQCQYRSLYSLKVFSDGTIGNCAMDFFKSPRVFISDLLNDSEQGKDFINHKKQNNLLNDYECVHCPSLFLCGGTNKLPCLRALNPTLCKNKIYNVNLEKFLKKYLEYEEKGKSDLFVVFKNGESYR